MANSVVEYAPFAQFLGTPARLTEESYHAQTEVLAGAMAVVGASIQLLNTGRGILEESKGSGFSAERESEQWQKLVNCSKAVADATKLLASAIRIHTPLPSVVSSRTTSLETFLK